jgi:hypothetical protein
VPTNTALAAPTQKKLAGNSATTKHAPQKLASRASMVERAQLLSAP